MTPMEVFNSALDLGQFAVLCGVFMRLGGLGATVKFLNERLDKLENRKVLHA